MATVSGFLDAEGRGYVDMYNNVPCVGHCHPHVVEAVCRQAQTLNVHSRYLHEGVLDYAERLTDLHEETLSSVDFLRVPELKQMKWH